MRRLLTTAAVLLALPPGAAIASRVPSPPETFALTPAQVGRGYVLQVRGDTNCVDGCPTLDLCGRSFASEAKRSARYQVNYRHPGAAVQISSEIVTYRLGAGALARAELGRAVATCPRTPVASHLKGVSPLTYRLTRLHDRALLPGALALEVHVKGKDAGKPFDNTIVAVYQFRGDLFSGVYAYPSTGRTLADQRRVGLHAAEAMASNLRRLAP